MADNDDGTTTETERMGIGATFLVGIIINSTKTPPPLSRASLPSVASQLCSAISAQLTTSLGCYYCTVDGLTNFTPLGVFTNFLSK